MITSDQSPATEMPPPFDHTHNAAVEAILRDAHVLLGDESCREEDEARIQALLILANRATVVAWLVSDGFLVPTGGDSDQLYAVGDQSKYNEWLALFDDEDDDEVDDQ